MTAASVSSPLALRPRDAAKALGISPRLLWQLTQDGYIPCVRVGSGKRRTVLYPLVDLQAWLTRQAAMTAGASNDPRGNRSAVLDDFAVFSGAVKGV